MTLLAVTTVGVDRPGIVAAVTGGLVGVDGNLQDAAMEVLGGVFAISLLVETPFTKEQVNDALEVATKGLDLLITVSEVEPQHIQPSNPTHTATLYGLDRPGFVHNAANVFAKYGINICNLQARILPSDDPVYVTSFELIFPDDLAMDGEEVIEEIRKSMPGVQASITVLDDSRM